MKQKTILFGENERHLEILKGFFQVTNFLRTIKVPETTIKTIENLVQQSYYKYGNFDFNFKLLPNNILTVDETKIALYQEGLNAGSTSFDLSSMYNSDGFQFDGLTNTLASSDDPTLVAIGTGLELLDGMGLDFQTNINNVLTYGLSSWGASTNPEQQQQYIKEETDYILSVLEKINDSNITEVINEAERAITYGHQSYELSLARRSWAKSTEAGWKVHIDAMKKVRKETVDKIITQLKSKGVIVSYTMKSEPQQTLEDLYRSRVSSSNTTAEKNGNITYKVYSFKIPAPQINTTTNQEQQQNTVQPTTNQQQPIQSNDTLLKVAGVGALAWFIIPKLMKS